MMNESIYQFHLMMARGLSRDKEYEGQRAKSQCDRGLQALGYTWEDIAGVSKLRPLVDTRRIVIYTLHKGAWIQEDVAKIIKKDRSSVSYHIKQAKDMLIYDKSFREAYNKFMSA